MSIELGEYWDIKRRLHSGARGRGIPLRCMFEVTYRCNLNCIHCYNARDRSGLPKEELSTEDVFKTLDRLKDLGTFYIGFTGGEPFVRRDILDILDYANRKGLIIGILSNGTLIDKIVADELERIGPNKVDISLYAMDHSKHDSITRHKGSHAKTMRAIKLLRERDIPVIIKTTIMQCNRNEHIATWKYATEELGQKFRCSFSLTPTQDGELSPLNYGVELKDRVGIKDEARKIREEAARLKGKDKKKIFLSIRKREKSFFRCGAGKTELTIDPYGRMKLCLDLPFPGYDILKTDPQESWNKIHEFVLNYKPSKKFKCFDCPLWDYCSWCPAISYLETGDMEKCVPRLKKAALFQKKKFEERQKTHLRQNEEKRI